ncbi:MAG: translation initiation factor IF-2 [Verrucomicrobiales bacterium]|nr:translation initiation factor IF-2 [Verrucomicrobiales bacterium]
MPVRIYDIAKSLGIKSKDVLEKAKDLGIQNARVASSSLDKITAEFLETEIAKSLKPAEAEPEEKPAEVEAPVDSGPVLIVAPEKEPEPDPEEKPEEEPQAETEDDGEEAVPADQEDPLETVEEKETVETPEPPAEAAEAAGPKVGEKIGFIDLGNYVRRPSRREQRESRKRDEKKSDRGKGDQKSGGPAKPKFTAPADAPVVTLKPPIIVRELAEQINRKPFQLIADLMKLGVFANVNQAIDEQTASQLCAKNGFKFEARKRERGAAKPVVEKKRLELDTDDDPKDLKPRPPVVTVMGHVDHGKTTLLDALRKANVVAGESGGITQHIGAYTVTLPHPEKKKQHAQITFLDTPGHAAFSAMRARGADVTDIVILVIAADDGVKPQTIEAINHAKESGAEIIVAVNKCDHPNANPQQARTELQEHGLQCEEWGGDTQFRDISALKKQGLDELLEAVLLQAEIMELKASANRLAVGSVVESAMEQGGPTATVLVRKGTLKVGQVVICGQHYGKVRALINEDGKRMKEGGPSVAAKLLGLNGAPEAGDDFHAVENEKAARELAENRADKAHQEFLEGRAAGVTLENLFDTIAAEQAKILKVIVKADTQGSAEAIVEALNKIESEKVSMEVIHSGVGTINESDVNLAASSAGVILGFHTRIDKAVPDLAKHHGVQIKTYKIIYELVDEVMDAMAGLLDPIAKEVVIGSAEVRELFPLSKGGVIAGCVVSDGRISRGKVRVMRRGKPVHTGETESLRRFKESVDVVRTGMDCGIRVRGFDAYEKGDVIESFKLEQVAQEL